MEASGRTRAPVTKTAKREQADGKTLSYNLNGQRLGRKGRDTRERILAATAELLAGPPDTPVTLSAVARKASLGMTSLYLYFSDLTELVLAVLEPIMASAEEAYIAHLRERWPDDALREHCLTFVLNYHAFWKRHSRILHLRNSMADSFDLRMVQHRFSSALPLIELLTKQMDCDPTDNNSSAYAMATALFTGLDRLIAVRTDADMPRRLNNQFMVNLDNRLLAEARLLELGIRDGRAGIDLSQPMPTLS